MNKKNTPIRFKMPIKPKLFIYEDANLLMSEENIKKFSKDYNFTYILDYINGKVLFKARETI